MFTRVDTVVLRVADYSVAADWYCTFLGFKVIFTDPSEGLIVLRLDHGTSLTLWQVRPGETLPDDAGYPFPVIATTDAAADRRHLDARGVRTSQISELTGLRFFSFWDLDGNRLEACQILVGGPMSLTHQ